MPIDRPRTKSSRRATTEEVIVGEHLAQLRGRVRFLTWVSGLCWMFVALFGSLLISGTIDWLIHFDESGSRLLIGLGIVGLGSWMTWRHLIAPLRMPLSGSFLAARIERRFPGLKNRVLSAVEFLEHRMDANLGSPELQKAVVSQALKDLERIEVSDVVATRAIRNVTIAGSAVCVLVAAVILMRPLEAATSIKRLVFPFSNLPWPRNVELTLLGSDLKPAELSTDHPLLIARGDTLELYVENAKGRLPERVWFEHQSDRGLIREPLRQTTLRDESGNVREAAVISWVATQGLIQFRVTGGDDDVMPLYQVEVVVPPTIESLQVVVTPPAYSLKPIETLPPGVGHISGLLGTEINVALTADKPLKSASLHIGENPPIPLEIESDERQLTTAFRIQDPGITSYWFQLTDLKGFTDRQSPRFEIRGIGDSVPEVTIEAPVTDVLLTEDAELPVAIFAKDDLGLSEIRIAYQVGNDETVQIIPLYRRPSPSENKDSANGSRASNDEFPVGPQQQVSQHLWKMKDLNPSIGTKVVFRGEATDDFDLGLPHIGKSVSRTISIVSQSEKQKELASRVGGLLEDLDRATQLQQHARQQTQELQMQLDKVGELRPQDVDQLQRTELEQRQATSRLTHPAEGVETQSKRLLDELHANRLNDSGMDQRLDRISNEIDRLEREELPQAESSLSRAQKLSEEKQSGAANKELKSALSEAMARQTNTLETLSELQESLAEWRDRRETSRDFDSLLSDQEKLQKDVAEMAHQTTSKSSAELSPQEKAELGKLANQQQKLAQQLDQFRKQLDRSADAIQKNDPESAEKLNEILKELEQKGTSGKLDEAARNISDNRMGAATTAQQQAIDELHEIERMIKRRPNESTEQVLQQTEEALREFQQLRDEQQNLADRVNELSEEDDSLAKKQKLEELLAEQQQLAERMAKAERKLERLRLRGPAAAVHRARKRLDEMMKHAQEAGDADEMQEAMDEALDDLEQAERELVLEKRIAQDRLAVEQLEKTEDELKALKSQQETVIAETLRLHDARTPEGRITRGQKKSLLDLAETERSLQHTAGQIGLRMASAEVFALVLKRLGRSLSLAANRLDESDTSDVTQSFEHDALKKIDSLLAVLQQEKKKSDQPNKPAEKQEELGQEPQEQDDKPEEASPPGEMLPQLAQLKLLKSLQEEYLERTEFFENQRDRDGNLSESMQAEMIELAREQAELADYARNLVAKFLQQRPERESEGRKEKPDKTKPDQLEKDPAKERDDKKIDL